jgi:hypothetical protein
MAYILSRDVTVASMFVTFDRFTKPEVHQGARKFPPIQPSVSNFKSLYHLKIRLNMSRSHFTWLLHGVIRLRIILLRRNLLPSHSVNNRKITLNVEAVGYFETLVCIYQNTCPYKPGDCNPGSQKTLERKL